MRPVESLSTKVYAYSTKGKATLSVSSNKQMALFNLRAINRTGSDCNVALMRKFGAHGYKVFTKVATAYTDVTSALQAGTSTQVVNTTNSDGFIIQAVRPFHFFGLTVANTATGGTYTFEYHNGTAWTTLTTLENFTNFNSTGDVFVAFLAPMDWAPGDASATGINQSMYAIRVLHTTAPADAGNINAVWVAEFLEFMEGVADNSGVQALFDGARPFILDAGESILPYFSTAAAGNVFAAFYGSTG